MKYSLENFPMKAMHILTVFKILLFKVGRYCHKPSSIQGAKRLNSDVSSLPKSNFCDVAHSYKLFTSQYLRYDDSLFHHYFSDIYY